MEDISKKLEDLRVARGIDIQELSVLSKLDSDLIKALESGDLIPTLPMVEKLCKVYIVNPNTFIKNTIVEWRLIQDKLNLDMNVRKNKSK
jgi:transcriptional regulator with XRE-family HTH domain